jgi:hypothetical protein
MLSGLCAWGSTHYGGKRKSQRSGAKASPVFGESYLCRWDILSPTQEIIYLQIFAYIVEN